MLDPQSGHALCHACVQVRVGVFYGGVNIKENIDLLNSDQKPHIVVGTPGRLAQLVKTKVRTATRENGYGRSWLSAPPPSSRPCRP